MFIRIKSATLNQAMIDIHSFCGIQLLFTQNE